MAKTKTAARRPIPAAPKPAPKPLPKGRQPNPATVRRDTRPPQHGMSRHTRPDVHGPGRDSRPRNEVGVGGVRPAAAKSTHSTTDTSRGAPGIRVRALETGYYADARRRPGDVFTIKTEKEFSEKWMEKVSARTKERTTTGRQALQQHHDEENAARLGLETDIDNPDDGSDGVLGDD